LASGLSKVKVAVWASASTLTLAAPNPGDLGLGEVRSAACRVMVAGRLDHVDGDLDRGGEGQLVGVGREGQIIVGGTTPRGSWVVTVAAVARRRDFCMAGSGQGRIRRQKGARRRPWRTEVDA
jgi:hypothetical protein